MKNAGIVFSLIVFGFVGANAATATTFSASYDYVAKITSSSTFPAGFGSTPNPAVVLPEVGSRIRGSVDVSFDTTDVGNFTFYNPIDSCSFDGYFCGDASGADGFIQALDTSSGLADFASFSSFLGIGPIGTYSVEYNFTGFGTGGSADGNLSYETDEFLSANGDIVDISFDILALSVDGKRVSGTPVVPLPAGGLLLASGIAVLVCKRRKRAVKATA